eukprot:gnl/Dysnectes_brevis/4207_a5561_773.p1 GENE.gnl/Dysnectes_brevis/4207_a5561_773~~gnl/Dysnectes_brevis/4207_a5561_773.p1  ORF type:complete len:512 (+),score=144.14 gnl/Dysnectes_brevis/4207_a5561_773:35-1570(+)
MSELQEVVLRGDAISEEPNSHSTDLETDGSISDESVTKQSIPDSIAILEAQRAKRARDLEESPIFRLLLSISLWSFISMAMMALTGIIDSAVLGQYVGEVALSAISVFAPIDSGVVIALLVFLSYGVSSIVSPALGRKDLDTAQAAVTHLISMSLILGILVPVIVIPVLPTLLVALGCTPDALPDAVTYGRIVLAAGPFTFLTHSAGGCLRCMHLAKLAAMRLQTAALINITLDLLFVGYLGYGVKGAAWATFISKFVVGVWMLGIWIHPRSPAIVRPAWKHIREIDWSMVWQIIATGFGGLVDTMASAVAIVIVNRMFISLVDDDVVYIHQAAFGAASRLLGLVSIAIKGLLQGFQPLAGSALGSQNHTRFRAASHLSIKLIVGVGVVSSGLLQLFAAPVARLFGSEPLFLERMTHTLRITSLLVWAPSLATQAFLVMQLEARPLPALLLGVVRTVLAFVPTVLVLSSLFGIEGILWSLPVADLVAGVAGAAVLVRIDRNALVRISKSEA